MSDTWDEIIELGSEEDVIVNGENIPKSTYRCVNANKKSVKQSEFYQAENINLKPELVFEIHDFEFDENNDKNIKYNNKIYYIIRTYRTGNEKIELIVSSYVGSGI